MVIHGKTKQWACYYLKTQLIQYTSGYIGFTTGTNDAYAVVEEYISRAPKAKIGKYLKDLKRLSQFPFGDPKRDDTTHLKGFPNAWKSATCNDPVFVQTQLDVGQSMYLKPALKYAAGAGVRSNLGKAVFYGIMLCNNKSDTQR